MYVSSSSSAQTVVIPAQRDGETRLPWGTVETSASLGWMGVWVDREAVDQVVPHLEELQNLIDSDEKWTPKLAFSEFEIGGVPVSLSIDSDGEVNVKVGRSYDYQGLLSRQQGMVVMKRLRRFVDGFKKENPSFLLWCYPNTSDGEGEYRRRVFHWAGFRQDKRDGRMSR